MTTRKLALLDVDNSLRDGWIISDWADALTRDGLFPSGLAHELRSILSEYQAGARPYKEISYSTPQIFARGLSGASVRDIRQHASGFLAQDPVGLRIFVCPLLSELRRNSIEPVLVSGAPQDIIDAASERYKLSSSYGTTFSQHDGLYTGSVQVNRASALGKQAVLDELLNNEITVELALGDSESDMPLFETARLSIVVDNPELARRVSNGVAMATTGDELSGIIKQLE